MYEEIRKVEVKNIISTSQTIGHIVTIVSSIRNKEKRLS